MTEKIVLAYSGGLDTSVAIRWLQEQYNAEVATLTMDLGGNVDLEAARLRALEIGAVRAEVMDAREEFVNEYVWPALQAGALYEGVYPLATALGRPLIAKHLVRIAQEEGASGIAHGCTGKGNDQVRFDVSAAALAPSIRVVAPAREWGMTRDDEIAYAQERNIPLDLNKRSSYSVDENLWGRSIEAGDLEDPWVEPPEEAYAWTVSAGEAPDAPHYVEIRFASGVPVGIDGEELAGVSLIELLNETAGRHGVGRIDHIENRLVGIKSREIYEAPAGIVLHQAHRALEQMCLTKEQSPLQGAARAGVRRPGLQRPVVHGSPPRSGRLRAQHPTPRERHGARAAAQGHRDRRGTSERRVALPARPRHVRRRRLLRPSGIGWLHQDFRAAGAHAGAGSRRGLVASRERRSLRTRRGRDARPQQRCRAQGSAALVSVHGIVISIMLATPAFAVMALASGQLARADEFTGWEYAVLSVGGIMNFLGGRFSQFLAIQAVGANLTAPVRVLSALFGALLGVTLLGEHVGLLRGAGIGCSSRLR